MATLTIRQLDDEVYARLKREAVANHRSIEAEARFQLGERKAASRDWAEIFRSVALDPGPDYPGSVATIRAIRDEE